MKPTTEKRRHVPPPPRDMETERVRSKGAGVAHQDRTDTDQANYRHERSEPKPTGPVAYK